MRRRRIAKGGKELFSRIILHAALFPVAHGIFMDSPSHSFIESLLFIRISDVFVSAGSSIGEG